MYELADFQKAKSVKGISLEILLSIGVPKKLIDDFSICQTEEEVKEAYIAQNQNSIIRSDNWREWNSFLGIFDSLVIGKNFAGIIPRNLEIKSIDEAINFINFTDQTKSNLHEVNKIFFELYCSRYGHNPSEVLSDMSYLVHKKSHSRTNGTIFIHPNDTNKYFVKLKNTNTYGYSTILINEDQSIQILNIDEDHFRLDSIKKSLMEIFNVYKEILGSVNDGNSYIMEFGLMPNKIYQFDRPKKICTADWNMNPKEKKSEFKADVGFGITSKEGIMVPINSYGFVGTGINFYYLSNDFKRFRNGQLDDFQSFLDAQSFDKDNSEGYIGVAGGGSGYIHTLYPNAKFLLQQSTDLRPEHSCIEDILRSDIYLIFDYAPMNPDDPITKGLRQNEYARIKSDGKTHSIEFL